MFEKYLKYKKKYLALKGGFALSQDCADFGIPPETAGEDDSEFLYPKMIKYFTENKDFYDQYLTKINNYSEGLYESTQDDYKNILIYFKSKPHINIFKILLDKFLEDDLQFYHVQYTSLIFLSFIIELELFMILYIYVPYNTETKQDNNNISRHFVGESEPTKNIYDKLLDNNILLLFKTFTCKLECIYKKYIEKLFKNYTQMFIKYIDEEMPIDYSHISEQERKDRKEEYDEQDKKTRIQKKERMYEIFYKKKEEGDYRHINHDWIKDLQTEYGEEITDIESQILSLFNPGNVGYFEYNNIQMGLFDFVFKKTNYVSCFTSSLIEFYFLSRCHVNYEDLYVKLQTEVDISNFDLPTLGELVNSNCTHWSTICITKKHRDLKEKAKQNFAFSFANKNEIFISFIFMIYDNYYFFANRCIEPFISNLKSFISDRQKLILNILYSNEVSFKSSIKINPDYVWKIWKKINNDNKYIYLLDSLEEDILDPANIPDDIINVWFESYTDKITYKISIKLLNAKKISFNDVYDDVIFYALSINDLTYEDIPHDIILRLLTNPEIEYKDIIKYIIFYGLKIKILKYEDIQDIISKLLDNYEIEYEDIPVDIRDKFKKPIPKVVVQEYEHEEHADKVIKPEKPEVRVEKLKKDIKPRLCF